MVKINSKRQNKKVEIWEDDPKVISTLLKQFKSFIPTSTQAYPSAGFGGKEYEDVVAVLSGSKPAALISMEELELFPKIYNRIFRMIIKKHFSLIAMDTEHIFIIGNPANCLEICRLFVEYSHKKVDGNYHIQLGRLLGYPENAISNFLDRWLDFESC